MSTHTSNGQPTTRRTWKPDGDAHLIFKWVKMEGKSQAWVADAFRISQSTVSRILQRYERWQAHAKEREDGRLDHAERLRAQRWLTFERNELMLTSCLRIAHEIEGFVDSSKSTVSRPMNRWSQEKELRSVHFTIDRTGMVARFLRLAFKINMEQLKLAEQDQPPPAQPLSEADQAEEERQAAADAAELAEARRRSGEQAEDAEASAETDEHGNERQSDGEPEGHTGRVGSAHHGAAETDAVGEAHPTTEGSAHDDAAQTDAVGEARPTAAPDAATNPSLTHPSPAHDSIAPLHNPHKLHNEHRPEIAANAALPCRCTPVPVADENLAGCITTPKQPAWPTAAIAPLGDHCCVTAAGG